MEYSEFKNKSVDELADVAEDIRTDLIEAISKQGGHLASNLGVVELTMALMHVFDMDKDQIVWDTSHQAYVYKWLTGRDEFLKSSLRQDDGCCGFLHREESKYDHFGAGHAGTALSAALGMAAVRDQNDENHRVIAVVGDGAFGCGVNLEGLNNIIETTNDFILILNDNKMSIAPNVGAFSKYFNNILTGGTYNSFKRVVADFVKKIPVVGPKMRSLIHCLVEAIKSVLVPGVLFEELGLRYIGPLDGHDLPGLIKALSGLKDRREQPLILHVLTEKGKGYAPAEAAPESYHSSAPFCQDTGEFVKGSGSPTFSSDFGHILEETMHGNSQVLSITAGMCKGTGLQNIREKFPDRLYDVGIAEEHAVVFAAGMAARGFVPVVAIYATFMQRSVDYVFHDICLQNLPVIFCLDRAGIVSDGPTHHGILDLSMWRSIPNLTVMQPVDGPEFARMMALAVEKKCPVIIRYPKAESTVLPVEAAELEWGKAAVLRDGTDLAIWALGRECARALEVAEILQEKYSISARVVNPRFFIPFDKDLLLEHASTMPVVSLEDHVMEGGLASIIKETLCGSGTKMLSLGYEKQIVPWGTIDGIRKKCKLSTGDIVDRIVEFRK